MDKNNIVDIFDTSEQKNNFATLEEAHRQGLLHKRFHLWVLDRNHQVWLRINSHTHPQYPAKFDVTASEHLPRHWDEDRGILELENLLALKINFLRLSPLFVDRFQYECPEGFENEITPVYLLKSLQRMSDLIMPPDVLDGIVAADIHGLIKLFNDEIPFLQSAGLIRDDRRHKYRMVSRKVMSKDFVDRPIDYYLRTFTSIRKSIGSKDWLMEL